MSKMFHNLTPAQDKAFGQIAIGQHPFCSPKTIRALLDKGLIKEGEDKKIYGKGNSPIDRIPVVVKDYYVPLDIHMEWCAWCAEQNIEEEEE